MSGNVVTYTPSPTGARFHACDDPVRLVVGPVGSGKSVMCCWELFRRAQQQEPGPDGVRRTVWLVGRTTYRALEDTTLRTWLRWFGRVGEFRKGDMSHRIRVGDVDMEVLFRAFETAQDQDKLLSMELTGGWLNEARAFPREIVEAVQGRIPRYPPIDEHGRGGATWSGLIMDTNPMDVDHWLYKLFEEQRPVGHTVFRQPSGLSPQAENLQYLDPNYYQRLQHGKTEDWVNVYIHGEYGFSRDGKPVHPEYSDSRHCPGEFDTAGTAPLYVGMDFGRTPAATFAQFVGGQWRVIHECVMEEGGADTFAALIRAHLREHPWLHDSGGRPLRIAAMTGDPAGGQGSQARQDDTVFRVLVAEGLVVDPAWTNDPRLREESLGRLLRTTTLAGEPAIVVHPRCTRLRKGLAGGYRLRRLKVAGEERYTDKPVKDMHSHVVESLHYLLVGAGEADNILTGERREARGLRKPTGLPDVKVYGSLGKVNLTR